MTVELTRGKIVQMTSDLNTVVHHLEQRLAKLKAQRLRWLEYGPTVTGFHETQSECVKTRAKLADEASLAIVAGNTDDLRKCLKGEPMNELLACERMYYDTKRRLLEHAQKLELAYVEIAIINGRLELYRSLIEQLQKRLDEIDQSKGGDGNEAG